MLLLSVKFFVALCRREAFPASQPERQNHEQDSENESEASNPPNQDEGTGSRLKEKQHSEDD